ncbi:major facilitator superfamily domain-containing protein [Lipomyces kononenkoae]|uniref:Major facilitator superfamily domain-containing protein n=1 Tax=Lipomyces kononenkoae TaxID=34357 RepID=A0ACC3SRH6_LIPKO
MLDQIQRSLSRQSAVQVLDSDVCMPTNNVVGALESAIPLKKHPGEESRLDEKQPSPSQGPDGGIMGWLQVSGGFFMFFNSWGLTNAFGTFETYYTASGLSNKNASDIAWIGSLQGFLLVVIGVITGPIFDRGYGKTLVAVGSLLLVFGMMMTSLGTQYWQVMLSQAVVSGLGEGCLFIPAVAIIPQYFTSKRAFATGVAASGSALGGVLFPIVFHQLQPRLGFGWTTRVMAFIILGTQAYAWTVMRVRSVPKFRRALYDPTAIVDFKFMVFTAAIFFAFASVFIPFYYVQSFAVDKNIFGEYVAFYMLSVMCAGSCFGRIFPNFIADKVGPLNMMIPCTLLTAVMAFVWPAVSSPGGCIVFAIFYGFFSGAFVSLPPPIIATLCPDLRMVGTRMGMSFSISGIGVLIGTPIAGALLSTPANYTATAMFCGACSAVASVLTIAVRVAKVGWKIGVKA